MAKWLRRLRLSQTGQGLVEYSLILSAVAVALMAVLFTLRNSTGNVYNGTSNTLGQVVGCSYGSGSGNCTGAGTSGTSTGGGSGSTGNGNGNGHGGGGGNGQGNNGNGNGNGGGNGSNGKGGGKGNQP
jgi:Flp pilus assembly pilin Flp